MSRLNEEHLPGRRRSLRLPAYDYGQPGAYFITIMTYQRHLLFQNSTIGTVVEDIWRNIPEHFTHTSLDEFVVMPNHVHGIIAIMDDVGAQHAAPLPKIGVRPGSLGAIVRSFKSASTRAINQLRAAPRLPVWQRNYYERVVRNEAELDRVRRYIRDNPARWDLDPENPANAANEAGYGSPGRPRGVAVGLLVVTDRPDHVGAQHAAPLPNHQTGLYRAPH